MSKTETEQKPEKQETAEELLARLSKVLKEKQDNVEKVREQLDALNDQRDEAEEQLLKMYKKRDKARDTFLKAQSDFMKAYVDLTSTKEQLYVKLLEQNKQQAQSQSQLPSQTKSERDDNL